MNGRGMGLYISWEVFNVENYDIDVVDLREGSIVIFWIRFIN